jgi:hypothetical protein
MKVTRKNAEGVKVKMPSAFRTVDPRSLLGVQEGTTFFFKPSEDPTDPFVTIGVEFPGNVSLYRRVFPSQWSEVREVLGLGEELEFDAETVIGRTVWCQIGTVSTEQGDRVVISKFLNNKADIS